MLEYPPTPPTPTPAADWPTRLPYHPPPPPSGPPKVVAHGWVSIFKQAAPIAWDCLSLPEADVGRVQYRKVRKTMYSHGRLFHGFAGQSFGII